MKLKYTVIALVALFAAQNASHAQDLDPTVVVNKAYEGKLVQVHKPVFKMEVPDSVTRFDLDFDYLVSEQPYKGADGFTPYVVKMKPETTAPALRKLYLNAGAGYTLHPTFDAVWSPLESRTFKMDVYARHRSYVGAYRAIAPFEDAGRVDWSGNDDAHWDGYDLMSRAGVDGRLEMESLSAGFDVSYYGLASKDMSKTRMYDALDVKLGVSSKPKSGPHFRYDVAAAYRFAEDKLDYRYYGHGYLGEHVVGADVVLGQVFAGGHQVLVDVEADVALYHDAAPGGGQFGNMWLLSVMPHYVLSKDRLGLDAGVRINSHGHHVSPDVKVSYTLIKDAMTLYAHIGGGSRLNTYASMLERNHHVDTRFNVFESGLANVTSERILAALGVEGRAGSVFSYNLRGGYANYSSDVLDAVVRTTDPIDGASLYLPGLGYGAYQKCFASLDWLLLADAVRFDGNVVYTHAWDLDGRSGLLLPAAVTGDVNFEYNWNRRIFAGVDCVFSTGRHGSVWVKIPGGPGMESAVIPGYADLGVSFKYAFNRDFSLWARGGNLLNMTVQRNPLYAEKGVNLTVGICLNL